MDRFGIVDQSSVVVVDPGSLDRLLLGPSLEQWAEWLLADPDTNARAATAKDWQDAFGPLEVTERLLHKQFLLLGGEHAADIIVVRDAVDCMRVRGPIAIAVAVKGLPDATEVRFETE